MGVRVIGMSASRGERLSEFLRRLGAAPPASNHDEAMALITDLLNQVEDEMTSIPHDPAFPLNDGRMYPPLADAKRPVSGRPDLVRYRSRAHSTIISDAGAIQIIDHGSGRVVLEKPGADGRSI